MKSPSYLSSSTITATDDPKLSSSGKRSNKSDSLFLILDGIGLVGRDELLAQTCNRYPEWCRFLIIKGDVVLHCI
jgi:hypothetical protein